MPQASNVLGARLSVRPSCRSLSPDTVDPQTVRFVTGIGLVVTPARHREYENTKHTKKYSLPATYEHTSVAQPNVGRIAGP